MSDTWEPRVGQPVEVRGTAPPVAGVVREVRAGGVVVELDPPAAARVGWRRMLYLTAQVRPRPPAG